MRRSDKLLQPRPRSRTRRLVTIRPAKPVPAILPTASSQVGNSFERLHFCAATGPLRLSLREYRDRLLHIGQQVLHVLDAYRESNQAVLEPETDTGPEACIEREPSPQAGEVTSSDNIARGPIGHQFQRGNQLWRRRNKAPGLQSSRRALREAFHKALTPDKMAACVAKMLDIIESSDKKAAVQAFKVLAECAGMRGESDSTRSGPSFTFVLPGPGAIPERPASGPPVVVVADSSPGAVVASAGLLTAELAKG